MRRKACGWLSLIAIVVGCNVFPQFIPGPPTDGTVVVGGISNTNPYFGRFRLANAPDVDMGLFMLASCGCGDWRVLFKPDDGSPQSQFPVQFYSTGEYVPTGRVVVQGTEDYKSVFAEVDQDGGLCDGRAELALARYLMSADRQSAHDQSVDACGLCHIGEDSVYPLPPTHPQKYKTNPRVCFECHTVDGQ